MTVKTTHKPNERHDAVFVTIEGDTTADYVREAEAFLAANGVELSLHVDQTVKAGGTLAAGGLQPQAPVASPMEQVQPAAQSVQQQPTQAPAWAQPQPQPGPQQSPTGASCGCGKVLEYATTRNGKKQLKCPDYRAEKNPDGSWAKNGNGHKVEWLD